jgi:hypothetical protein
MWLFLKKSRALWRVAVVRYLLCHLSSGKTLL